MGKIAAIRHFLVASISVLALGACGHSVASTPAKAVRSGTAVLTAPPIEQLRVDISGMGDALGRLSADEQSDQLADWAVAATVGKLARSDPSLLEAVAARPLLRTAQLEALGVFEYGPGRTVVVSSSRALLFVPGSDTHPRTTLARLADKSRAELGQTPNEFDIWRFSIAPDRHTITIDRQGTVRGTDLFTEAYGYVEQKVRSVSELEHWLSVTEELDFFKLTEDGFVVGGRHLETPVPRTTVDDVRALYQGQLAAWPGMRAAHRLGHDLNSLDAAQRQLVDAYNANVNRVRAGQQPDVLAFDGAVTTLGKLFGDASAHSLDSCAGASPADCVNAEYELISKITPVTAQAMKLDEGAIDKALRESEHHAGPGFSLDPQWDVARLVADLETLKKTPEKLIARARNIPGISNNVKRGAALPVDAASELLQLIDQIGSDRVGELHPSVVKAIDSIITEARAGGSASVVNLPQFVRVRNSLGAGGNPQGVLISRLLGFVESQDRVQCARYEGALAGTRAGMNLFYTDLLAKLWAGLDYQGSAPLRQLPGFSTLQGLAVDKDESSTRLWFGARSDRISRNDDYSVVHFAPVVSRVFSAASNVLEPGKETVPEDGVRHVLDWWTNHFESVSEYDRQYHLQNELQKWSLLTQLLAYQDIMPDLDRGKVEQKYRFDDWAKRTSDTQVPNGIGLISENRWIGQQRNWECMDLLASRDATGVRVLYGGVTLADMTQAQLPPLRAGHGPAMHDGDSGRFHRSAREGDNGAWYAYGLESARLPKQTAQQKKLWSRADRDGDRVTQTWQGEDGKGGKGDLKFTGNQVMMSATNLDFGHRAHTQEFANLEQIKAQAANDDANQRQTKPDPRLQRTQGKSSDDDPPNPTQSERGKLWRDALRGQGTTSGPSNVTPAKPGNSGATKPGNSGATKPGNSGATKPTADSPHQGAASFKAPTSDRPGASPGKSKAPKPNKPKPKNPGQDPDPDP